MIDLFSRRTPPPLTLAPDPVLPQRRFSEDELVANFLAMKGGSTVDDYRRDIVYYRQWLRELSGHGVDLYEAEEWHVGDWKKYMLETKEWAPATARRRMTSVGGMYEWALRSRLHDRNPEYAVKRPTVGDNVQYTGLVLPDLKALSTHAKKQPIRTTAIVALLMTTGMRVSELCNASVDGLAWDGPKLMLRITRKGGKSDRVEVPQGTYQVLTEYLGDRSTGPLILGERGEAISRHVVWRMIRGLGDAALPHLAGKLHPHDLRHSFVSLLWLLTGDARKVQGRAGHTDINHTFRYAHALEGRESTEVEELEAVLGFLS
ncbi:tyrosine-type recombinase/integrase [Streptomyces atratus]|uniref:tyrosine-type recombinase/integrase n=1 Tax=Streptomyces atratus TaxID=1893 RepID=UPI003649272C